MKKKLTLAGECFIDLIEKVIEKDGFNTNKMVNGFTEMIQVNYFKEKSQSPSRFNLIPLSQIEVFSGSKALDLIVQIAVLEHTNKVF